MKDDQDSCAKKHLTWFAGIVGAVAGVMLVLLQIFTSSIARQIDYQDLVIKDHEIRIRRNVESRIRSTEQILELKKRVKHIEDVISTEAYSLQSILNDPFERDNK